MSGVAPSPWVLQNFHSTSRNLKLKLIVVQDRVFTIRLNEHLLVVQDSFVKMTRHFHARTLVTFAMRHIEVSHYVDSNLAVAHADGGVFFLGTTLGNGVVELTNRSDLLERTHLLP